MSSFRTRFAGLFILLFLSGWTTSAGAACHFLPHFSELVRTSEAVFSPGHIISDADIKHLDKLTRAVDRKRLRQALDHLGQGYRFSDASYFVSDVTVLVSIGTRSGSRAAQGYTQRSGFHERLGRVSELVAKACSVSHRVTQRLQHLAKVLAGGSETQPGGTVPEGKPVLFALIIFAICVFGLIVAGALWLAQRFGFVSGGRGLTRVSFKTILNIENADVTVTLTGIGKSGVDIEPLASLSQDALGTINLGGESVVVRVEEHSKKATHLKFRQPLGADKLAEYVGSLSPRKAAAGTTQPA
ncbi:hypothetical protein [Litoreibacter roseus]|uniref:Uncharacterized protein n=1 Tax=Litoreibacter roseus TaxID=2601869 RepID=A0A6N6JMZ7_9RHOB|nr:hypothetical protein [Litoreibacter roseus]GFE66718.1 hypothetical protein KIN_37920 [Litoreibacter roseus]